MPPTCPTSLLSEAAARAGAAAQAGAVGAAAQAGAVAAARAGAARARAAAGGGGRQGSTLNHRGTAG